MVKRRICGGARALIGGSPHRSDGSHRYKKPAAADGRALIGRRLFRFQPARSCPRLSTLSRRACSGRSTIDRRSSWAARFSWSRRRPSPEHRRAHRRAAIEDEVNTNSCHQLDSRTARGSFGSSFGIQEMGVFQIGQPTWWLAILEASQWAACRDPRPRFFGTPTGGRTTDDAARMGRDSTPGALTGR